MVSVIDFLHRQSDVEKTVSSSFDDLPGGHSARGLYALHLCIPPKIEMARTNEQ